MRLYLSLLLLFPVSALPAQQLECPTTFKVESTASAPPEWTSFSASSPHVLDRVGFYSGSPREGASLVPESQPEKAREARDGWRFEVAKNEPIWLACFYTGTDRFLAKQIDRGLASCNVSYKLTKSGSRIGIQSIVCD